MTEQFELDIQIEALKEKLQRLDSELQVSRRQIAQMLETIELQRQQIRAQQVSIARLDRIQMEMLTGRVWRTLQATSDVVKKIVPARLVGGMSGSTALSRKRSFLVCDEPRAKDKTPRSGLVAIRGWCLAEGGVDSVEVSIRGLPRLETKPNVPRPDVKKAHPDLDMTGYSGFGLNLDSAQLPNGTHPITIRIISGGVPVRETHTALVIDHEKGFASDYDRWIHEFEIPDDNMIKLKVASFQQRPLISIVMPVYNTNPPELAAAIKSVTEQSYTEWELCIADDSSTRPEIRTLLEQAAQKDSRIKIYFRPEQGGISQACNSAVQMASGEYIGFLDHDDTLSLNALAYVCEVLERKPDADLIYSDEDKIDKGGSRYEPFFKPDWSPDLLLSENYICHFLVLREDLARRIGKFNSDCDGSQDYDLVLRAAEQARRIEHIPRVLYHWRAGDASTAATIENKQYALEAARNALQRHCRTKDAGVEVQPGNVVGRWRVRYSIPEQLRVSIIIASGGKTDILKANLEALYAKTTFHRYEVVVIDNSKADAIANLIKTFPAPADRPLRYIDYRFKPFNYSAINNEAARDCDSPVLLFLNDDTVVIAEDWLESMVELIGRPEVGGVGAKLLYPDGKIQHAGVVMGIFDNCGHAFKALDGSISHYFDFSDVIRNVSAVTGACLMTRSEIFWHVGGFDDKDFAVAFNDIDLCLKIGRAGYRMLYTPHALLYHYEAKSKTSKDLIPHPEEVARMRAKWGDLIQQDPFYSPNLTRNDENYSIKTLD